jgi:hypothetical protein
MFKPRPGRVGEVQRQVTDEDFVGGGPAQLARQAIVVEPYAGVCLPIVFVDRRGLAEALREARRADLPTERAGSRGLRRRRAVLSAIIAPTPPGVVACRRPRLRVARPRAFLMLRVSPSWACPRVSRIRALTDVCLGLAGRFAAPPTCTDASRPCAPPSSRALPC